jgi:protein-tyrosine phosphatase
VIINLTIPVNSQYTSFINNEVNHNECSLTKSIKIDPQDIYNNADLIIDKIYLGNIRAASNITWLIENNISVIFNLASEWDSMTYNNNNIELLYFPLDDSNRLDMKDTRRFINKVTNKLIDTVIDNNMTNILVHCNMGISRSVTIVIRYLQMVYGMNYKEALNYIKNIRPIVKPNTLFKRILIGQDTYL